jgi:2-polyprenyl-3-methyl-5-hydroxy-6-metoxy-1,4-benzoquinol methylase
MYGTEQADLVVKYYDVAFGITGEAESNWYREKAKASGGPILDLACGTGRLALLLARDGFQVTGIDQSVGMLNLFKEKRNAQPPEVRRRIQIEHHSMSAFRLGEKFNTILCCDAFFHNLTTEEQMNCLTCVAQHLTPRGRFLFNLPNPSCEFILKSEASGGKDFEERGRYTLPDGTGTVVVEQAQAGSALDQSITTTLRMTRYDAGGKEVEKGESHWTTRYLFRYEAIHLLARCGFQVETLVGDYRNGPVTEKSQLIFEVKLSDSGPGPSPLTCGQSPNSYILTNQPTCRIMGSTD